MSTQETGTEGTSDETGVAADIGNHHVFELRLS
jgi:hypothetical protein